MTSHRRWLPGTSARWPLVGVVHLEPLPTSPRWGGSLDAVLERARSDAAALEAGGMDGLLFENFGDAPFVPDDVPPAVVAAMTAVVREATRGSRLPFGVNVLRNDARSALGVAVATGAAFLRVNVHAGCMVSDQGLLQGRAHETLRERASLGHPCLVLADLLVKHARPLGETDLTLLAADTHGRACADALVLTGRATGEPPAVEDAAIARDGAPLAPLLLGSGLDASNAAQLLPAFDGALVGSSLRRDGRAGEPVEEGRVRDLVARVRALRREPGD